MIASRSGRYWYSEATDTPASSATRVVVSTAGPSATRMRSAAASTCISRSRLRACCGIRRRPAQSRSKASVICTAAPLCHISGSSVRLPSVRSRHASACPASCAVYRSGDSGSPLLIAASRNGQTPYHPGLPVMVADGATRPRAIYSAGNTDVTCERCGRNNAAVHHSHGCPRHDQKRQSDPASR